MKNAVVETQNSSNQAEVQFKKLMTSIGLAFGKIILVLIAIIATVLIVANIAGYSEYLNYKALVGVVTRFHDSWLAFAFFQFLYVIGSWILLPLTVTTVLALLVFPLWKAVAGAALGIFLSATITYIGGRYFFNLEKSRRFRSHADFIKQQFNEYGYWAVVALRIAPQPPFIVTSVLSGAMKLSYIKYMGATFLGLTPIMLLTFVLGRRAIVVMKDPSFIAISLLIGAVLLIPLFIVFKKRLVKRMKTQPS